MTELAHSRAPDAFGAATTIAHRLEQHARHRESERAVTFLGDGDGLEARTWGELAVGARTVAAALGNLPPAQEPLRALLLLPQDATFLDALFGCFFAGVCAIPAHVPLAPRLAQTLPRLRAIIAEARPHVVLTTRELSSALALVPELGGMPSITVDELHASDGPAPALNVTTDHLAILQYSSGSTGTPRGVMVTHRNLMANETLIEDAFEHTPASVFLSWLPFQHDMGLIGMLLQPIFVGAQCVMMTPEQFLKHPLRWLAEITRHGATTSGAPNFAYERCVAAARRLGPDSLVGLDLSRWNLAFVGAEPVRSATLERFATSFAEVGFRPEALYPCYGLAEATLLVSGVQRDEPPATWRDPRGMTRVSCGRPRAGLDFAIVDTATGARCDDGVEGEIWVRGDSVAQGYFHQQQASRDTFDARLDGMSWLRTGDLGYRVDDELYITGRLKDVIVKNGIKYAAEDVEHSVVQLHADALHAGGCAAFGHDDGTRERMVIVQEIGRGAVTSWADIADRIFDAIADEHGTPPDEVVFVERGSIPRTTSGKIRRSDTRELYARGELAGAQRHVTGASA